jgi:hypothetical protein
MYQLFIFVLEDTHIISTLFQCGNNDFSVFTQLCMINIVLCMRFFFMNNSRSKITTLFTNENNPLKKPLEKTTCTH